MRRPVTDLPEFIAQHEGQQQHMQKFMTTKLGRHAVDDITAENFKYPAALSLKAMNALARIAVAHSAKKVITKNIEKMKDIEFLTMCPRDFAVPMSMAASFQLGDLITWAQKTMGRCHHISFVDLAYYSNLSVKGDGTDTAHFHVHSLRWDEEPLSYIDYFTEKEVFETTYPLVPGLDACHARRLKSAEIAGRAIYMAKIVDCRLELTRGCH